MRLAHGAWVVVADGEKFILFENVGDADHIVLSVKALAEHDNPAAREQGADRPGRYHTPQGGRSAVTETDWHVLEKARFAAELAERLRRSAEAGRFTRAVLIADPRTLGALRPHLHDIVRQRIVKEIPRDVAHQPTENIERLIAEA